MNNCIALLISDRVGEYLIGKIPIEVWENTLGAHGDKLRESLQILKNSSPDIAWIVAMESTWEESAEDIAFHAIIWRAL